MEEVERRRGRHFNHRGLESPIEQSEPQSWALTWVLLTAAADSRKHTQRGVIAELRTPLHTRQPPLRLAVND